MLAHLLLDSPSVPPFSSTTRSQIKGYFLSESITDVGPLSPAPKESTSRSRPSFPALASQIDALVAEYPDYQGWFITAAFGPGPYLVASPANPSSRTLLFSSTLVSDPGPS